MPSLSHDHFLAITNAELNPVGFLEQIIANEIAGATFRLYRCNAAEANLGEIDPSTVPTRRSIERSRAAAMLALNRATAMLRKLRNERRKGEETHEESDASRQSVSNCKTEETAPEALHAQTTQKTATPTGSATPV